MGLILASSSMIRRAMLDQAGLTYTIQPPACDEQAVKLKHAGNGEELAIRLAELKAASITVAADDWVIGADSVISVDGVRFSKPRDRDEATAHLRAFSGRTMILSSAAGLARGGAIEWRHGESAHLTVRPLSTTFIADYLDAEWPDVGQCAGVFRMEGRGVTLFERVEGSHFTILGLPLISLLGALRERGVVAA